MRRRTLLGLSLCLTACSKPAQEQAPAQDQASTPAAVEPEPAATTPSEAATTEPPTSPAERATTDPVEQPAIEPTNAGSKRWIAAAAQAPSRVNPPATSVLGTLPEADAIALVSSDAKLELVAVNPGGWRMPLATGEILHPSFEPATGLLTFMRGRSIWAIDLLEPREAAAAIEPVELVRIPASAPEHTPETVILCFPDDKPMSSCWPARPLPDDLQDAPEYLEITWADEPSATWFLAKDEDYEDDDDDDDADSYELVALELVGGQWLRERADRRKQFAAVSQPHTFWQATPLAAAPKLGDRCDDAEDCGKSLPFGRSGWEWVVVGSSRGDLFHVDYAVLDPERKRWTGFESLAAGQASWIPQAQLLTALDQLGGEHYPLFDGSGRVFVGEADERLCWFVFEQPDKPATAVSCTPAGGRVVGFLSVPTSLGMF